MAVILSMVLQIHNTIVLQRAERDGKVRAVHFWVFGSLASLMGKHGFAEKLHFKLKLLSDEVGSFQNFT